MSMSLLKDAWDLLKDVGFNPFMPGQHKGECIEPYVVVKLSGVLPLEVSSERPIYTFLVYVPENEYTKLETNVFAIKQELKKLYPRIMYAGNETESFYDEQIKAHMISFQYYGIRKLENR